MNAEKKGKKTRLLRYLIAIASIKIVFGLNEGKYPASLPTLNEVPDCPRNKEDWQEAAERKHCDRIKNTDHPPFVYHCLINAWANATVEVCAPTWYISGYCAMYSVPDARVIDNEKYDCTKYTPPCPTRYLSSDAYNYSVCYDIARPKTIQSTSLVNITQESSTESSSDATLSTPQKFTTIYWILGTVIPAVFIIVLSVGSLCLCKVIRKRKADKSTTGTEEGKVTINLPPSDKKDGCNDELDPMISARDTLHRATESQTDSYDNTFVFQKRNENLQYKTDSPRNAEDFQKSDDYIRNYTVAGIKDKLEIC